ncbi:hypothetical protein U1Q18_033868, partial [Sarracenia purpurea var. burkii]
QNQCHHSPASLSSPSPVAIFHSSNHRHFQPPTITDLILIFLFKRDTSINNHHGAIATLTRRPRRTTAVASTTPIPFSQNPYLGIGVSSSTTPLNLNYAPY